MKKIIITCIVAINIFAICNPLGNATNAANSFISNLTAHSWKLSTAIANPAMDTNYDGVPETNIFPNVNSCIKDNLFTFSNVRQNGGITGSFTGTVTLNEGSQICSNFSSTQTGTFAYTLFSQMVMTFPNGRNLIWNECKLENDNLIYLERPTTSQQKIFTYKRP